MVTALLTLRIWTTSSYTDLIADRTWTTLSEPTRLPAMQHSGDYPYRRT